MLIVEELYLLLHKDNGKPESAFTQAGYGMNAAIISDLILAGRIELSEDKNPRVLTTGAGPMPDPVLAAPLEKITAKPGRRLQQIVGWQGLYKTQLITDSLAKAGIVEYGEKSFFGLGAPRVTVLNGQLEHQLRATLRAVLHGAQVPDVHSATLLSILAALDALKSVLAAELEPLTVKEAKARIKQLPGAVPTADAVTKAVMAMNSALMMSAIMPAVISGGAD